MGVNEGAERLLDYRHRKGLSQMAIAQRMGWFVQEISAYETGRRKPSLKRAMLLRNELGIPVGAWTVEKPNGHSEQQDATSGTPEGGTGEAA